MVHQERERVHDISCAANHETPSDADHVAHDATHGVNGGQSQVERLVGVVAEGRVLDLNSPNTVVPAVALTNKGV